MYTNSSLYSANTYITFMHSYICPLPSSNLLYTDAIPIKLISLQNCNNLNQVDTHYNRIDRIGIYLLEDILCMSMNDIHQYA